MPIRVKLYTSGACWTRAAGIAPSNILNFAIVLRRISSNEHKVHHSTNLAEIRAAYLSGIGLRQLVRNMNIPAGTVLARSKREGWDPADRQGETHRPTSSRSRSADAINDAIGYAEF